MPRLVACYGCNNLIKLRDISPDTPPSEDHELVEITRKHESHCRHLGTPDRPAAQMFIVDQATYDALDVEHHVKDMELNLAGRVFNEMRDELVDDAISCWKAHKSPTIAEGCVDYKTDAKILGNGKRLPPEQRMYLCAGCPLSSEWSTDDVEHKGARRGHRGIVVPQAVRGPRMSPYSPRPRR